MVSKEASRLLEHCQDRAGSSVRAVVTFTGSEFRTEFLRDDLQAEYSEERMESVVGIGREIHRIRRRHVTEGTPLGKSGASVRMYQNAIVIQIPLSESRGILAIFDPAVGRDLVSFIHECQEKVYAGV